MPRSVQPSTKKGRDAASIIQVPQWLQFPWLAHGFSTRQGGVSSLPGSRQGANLNLGSVPWDRPANVLKNRRKLLAALRADSMRLVALRQVHSDLIRLVEGTDNSEGTENPDGPLPGDGLVTNAPGLLLTILVADCLPVLLIDVRQRAVAALHCGWRGTLRRLAQKGVGRMMQMFGSRERDLRAAIGPGIGACCYRVGQEVAEQFEAQFPYSQQLLERRTRPLSPMETKHPLLFSHLPKPVGPCNNEDVYLDLVRANLRQLQEAGVSEKHIFAEAPCTHCNPELFFSFRRDGALAGRMMGVIGIRPAK